jgi:hypothetical protein
LELNLHIIAEDLALYCPQTSFEEDYPIRRLRFPALFDGQETRRSLLYIVEAATLTPVNIANVTECSSLLVIGQPPKALFARHCNIAWIEDVVTLARLFSEVAGLFASYGLWSDRLQDVLITKKRLSKLAELSLNVVGRPIYLVDSFLQVLFHVSHDLETPVASQNEPVMLDNDNPELSVLALDRFGAGTHTHEQPFVLGKGTNEALLSQNIFIDGHLIATLAFGLEYVGKRQPFNNRDYSLLLVLADAVQKGLTYKDEWNTSAPNSVAELVRALLRGERVASKNIDSALMSMAWHDDDAYCCIVAVPADPLYPSGLLAAIAKRAAANASQMIYVVNDQVIVFVVNVDHSTLAIDEIVELIIAQLGTVQAALGVSNICNGFRALEANYHLAQVAAELGTKKNSDLPWHRFEDYFMDYLQLKCTDSTPLEAMLPRGVLQLARYDEKYGTDLVNILRVYLKHDMRVATAARELFLHRNTLTSKISQISFLTRMDFENDPNVRLRLMIALWMMEG